MWPTTNLQLATYRINKSVEQGALPSFPAWSQGNQMLEAVLVETRIEQRFNDSA